MAITILVFAAFGEAVLTGSLFKRGREDLARKVDQWARWVYLGALMMRVSRPMKRKLPPFGRFPSQKFGIRR